MYAGARFLILPIDHSCGYVNTLKLIDTGKYYKIFYVACGSSAIYLNKRLAVLEAGDIVFQRPGDRPAFYVSKNAKAYLCLVHNGYLSADSNYLLDLFSHFPLCHDRHDATSLNGKQSEIVKLSFESIIAEQENKYPDRKQATLLHLQMIMLQIQRAGRKIGYAGNNSIEFSWAGLPPFSFS